MVDLTDATSYTNDFLDDFGGGTPAGASTALLDGLNSGSAYFNIHTTFAPGGEIRGFLAEEGDEQVPVPEPASSTLLSVGLAGLGARRWRQRTQ